MLSLKSFPLLCLLCLNEFSCLLHPGKERGTSKMFYHKLDSWLQEGIIQVSLTFLQPGRRTWRISLSVSHHKPKQVRLAVLWEEGKRCTCTEQAGRCFEWFCRSSKEEDQHGIGMSNRWPRNKRWKLKRGTKAILLGDRSTDEAVWQKIILLSLGTKKISYSAS